MVMIVRASLLCTLLVAPLSVLSESRVEIPTRIQVVDAGGRTVISTSTSVTPEGEPRVPFSIPKICMPVLNVEPVKVGPPSLVPKMHPLSTRIESQRSVLRMLTEEVSFAPYLSQKEEQVFKRHLESLGGRTDIPLQTLECLSLLHAEFQARTGIPKERLTHQITETVFGLQYGMRNLSTQTMTPPTTEQEALYAGDILLSRCPSCLSLSVRTDRVDIQFSLPVHLFGQWERSAIVHLLLKDNVTHLNAPWWLFLGSHHLPAIETRVRATRAQGNGIPEMFVRAQEIMDMLP